MLEVVVGQGTWVCVAWLYVALAGLWVMARY